jgi:hypothetical protein
MSEQYNLNFSATPDSKDPEREKIDALLTQTVLSLAAESKRLQELIKFNARFDPDSARELEEQLAIVETALQIKLKESQ